MPRSLIDCDHTGRVSESESSSDALNSHAGPTWDHLAEIERSDRSRDYLRQHAALVVSGVSLATLVIKVMRISHRQPTTALSTIQHAGVFEVLAGVVVLTLPFFAVGLITLITAIFETQDLDPPEKVRLWIWFGILVFVLSFFVAALLILMILGYVVFRAVLSFCRRRKGSDENGVPWLDFRTTDTHLRLLQAEYRRVEERPSPLPLNLGYVADKAQRLDDIKSAWRGRYEMLQARRRRPIDVVALSLLLTAMAPVYIRFFDDRPWLPPERIEFDGASAEVGYVLGEEGGWTAILRDDDRSVDLVESEAIEGRELCALEDEDEVPRTLYEWLGADNSRPTYPPCWP